MDHNVLSMTVPRFIEHLNNEGIRRAHLVYDRSQGKVSASHPQLEPVAKFMNEDTRDFMGHEGVFLQTSEVGHVLQAAFVHKTCRGQASGGMRYWTYPTVESFLRDGLRLSKGMTRKNALAGLWWGGGKGMMSRDPNLSVSDPSLRERLYKEYASLISAIRGCYITAEDVGTAEQDMLNIHMGTRFATCIPAHVGGSGNPSTATARGVAAGIEASLEFASMGEISGKHIVVQGMGHVGEALIKIVLERGAHVSAVDINPSLVNAVYKRLNSERLTAHAIDRSDSSILSKACDVLAPCATGAVINPNTIPTINAKIVCGAANNQLEDTIRDGELLRDREIIYVPDFLVNRMGIVNCANEQYGHVSTDPMIERHLSREWEHSVHQTTLRVLDRAAQRKESPAVVAIQLADTLSHELHPIFGRRGQAIIDGLVADRWFDS